AAVRRVAQRQTAVADRGPRARWRVERRDAGASGTDALGERALRRELHLEFPREVLALELLVLADVARDHLRDLLVAEEDPEAETVDSAVVGDEREVLHAELADRADRVFRNAAQAEAAGEDGRAARDVVDRLPRALLHLVHGTRNRRPTSTRPD